MSQKLEPITFTSTHPNTARITELQNLFPEAFTEGKIDFEQLRTALGEAVDVRLERYNFTWAGKQDAIRILQTPTSATLLPVPKESVNFNETQNIFIEGDNLEVLKLLYKSYFGRVKMIYIDPPYNTGGDFIYPDNYADPLDTYLQLTGQKDQEGNFLTTNRDTSGRYHSAWLTMMYPRLFIARQLLRNDGVIFISIDDNEVHNLRLIMNEIFGEENFVAQVCWKNKYGAGAKTTGFVDVHGYILCYSKSLLVDLEAPMSQENLRTQFNKRDDKYSSRGGYMTQPLATTSMDDRPNLRFPIYFEGEEIWPEKQWVWSRERVKEALEKKELVITRKSDGKFSVRYKQYAIDENGIPRRSKPLSILNGPFNQEGTKEIKDLFGDPLFSFPKPSALIGYFFSFILNNIDEKDGIYMDFFAGSCATTQAILDLNHKDDGNRKFIVVQLPEPTPDNSLARKAGYRTIADIGKERIRRVIAKIKSEKNAKLPLEIRSIPEDLGFKIFRLSPSNLRAWHGTNEPTHQEFADQMALFDDPLVEGWKPANVIFEIALKEGYSLNCHIQHTAVAGHVVYLVSDQEKDQQFYICLDDKITQNLAAELELTPNDLFICRDIALDDTMVANLALQSRLKTI